MTTEEISTMLKIALCSLAIAACSESKPEGEPPAPGETAADAGTSGDVARDAEADVDPSPPASEISEHELMRRVSVLASDDMDGRDEGTPGGLAARRWVIGELTRCGIPAASASGFEQPIQGGNGANVLGLIPGTDPALKDRVVILGAHYDHLGACGGEICNGANDNAAGVAIAIGVACELAKSPPRKSVLVALWDAEEPPTFLTAKMGSEYYAANPLVPLSETDAVVTLDLVGADLWPAYRGHFVLGDELSAEVRAAVDAAAVPEGLLVRRGGLHLVEDLPIGFQAWSDYHPFRQRSVPVLFLSNGRNRDYHDVEDEVGLLDPGMMALEAKYLGDVVKNLGDTEASSIFVRGGALYGRDLDTMEAILSDAIAPGGLVDAYGYPAMARARFEEDLAAIQGMHTRVSPTGALARRELDRMRRASFRVLCLTGPEAAHDPGMCYRTW